MVPNTLRQIVSFQALLADDYEIYVHTLRPELFHRGKRLLVSSARFHGADHKEAWAAAELCEHPRRVFRQACGRRSGAQVGTQMEEPECQGLQPRRLRFGEPCIELVSDSARDARDAIC